MTARRTWRLAWMAVLAVSLMAATGCASKSINQILADPSRYSNREVRVSGEVVESYSVTNRGAYRIDDTTGQLWVLSDKGVPRKGARVTVKGTIRDGFNLGSLGDRFHLPPGVSSGLVMMAVSHKAQR
ncbi:MAG: hypothetical protein Q8L86_15730 [Vicinamibacterales bacterium]|nr:hypothetical protein [Vicinamibacterales bacterium]